VDHKWISFPYPHLLSRRAATLWRPVDKRF